MMKRRMFTSLLVCLPLLAPGVSISAEKPKLVSMKVIKSKGAVVKLKDGTKVKIVDIKNLKMPEKECSLDLNSVRHLSIDQFKRGELAATAEMNLQAKIGSQGHPYCAGQGSGCVMTVEVPDAKILEKLSR